MKQFHIYKIDQKYKPSEYHALLEGFSWYGLFFSVVWLFFTSVKRGKFWEFYFLLFFVGSVITLFLVGLVIADGIILNGDLGNFLIEENPVLGIVFGYFLSHIFLGFQGNAILRWAYQNDEHLGIVTASTENGAITLYKQNNNIDL